jgi:hypothetical protein
MGLSTIDILNPTLMGAATFSEVWTMLHPASVPLIGPVVESIIPDSTTQDRPGSVRGRHRVWLGQVVAGVLDASARPAGPPDALDERLYARVSGT